MARPSRRAVAFTLVELLVVIAIIVLLVSILSPSLRRARDLALSANCLGRTHSLSTGYATWLTNNQFLAMGHNRDTNTMSWDWSDELAPYVQGSDITFCPKVTEFTSEQLVVGTNCLMGGRDWAWRHKPPHGTETYEGSYGLNQWIMDYDNDTWATWQDPQRKLYFETHMGIVKPNIEQVARHCGFSSAKQLHAVMLRELGVGPTEYRRRHAASGAAPKPDKT